MKHLTIYPTTSTFAHNEEATPAGEALQAVNLRRREKSVEVVGNPEKIGSVPAGHKIIAMHCGHYVTTLSGGLYCDGNLFFQTDATVLDAHSIGSFLVVNTASGVIYFTGTDGTLVHLDISGAIPELHLAAIDTGTVSDDIPPYNFTVPLANWRGPLSAADAQSLASIIADTYRHLQKKAKSNCAYTRPVLARYGVRLNTDKYLWISAPVVIGHSVVQSHYRTQSEAIAGSGSYTGIASCSLSLPTFKIGVSVVKGTGQEWISAIKSIDIFITEEADIADTTMLDYRIAITSGNSRRYIAELGPEPRDISSVMDELMSGKWHLVASCTQLQALSSHEFLAWGATQNATSVLPGVPAYILSLSTAFTQTLTNADCAQITSRASTEHLPACTLNYGGRLYCGGGRKRFSAIWPPSALFLPPFTAKPCTVSIIEKLATTQGEGTIVTSRTYPFTPSAVNPLICAPHSAATSLRFELGTQWAECALTPLHACGMAATFTSDLHPLALENGAQDYTPTTHDNIISTPGALAVSDIAFPLTTAHSQTVTGVELLAMAATERPVYSGGFGRYPLYLFTDHGVFIVPQKSDGTFGEARLMSRKLMDAQAPAVSGDGKIWFISSHLQLCYIEGSKVKAVAPCQERIAGMAWNDKEQELWTIGSDGTLRITDEAGFSSRLTLKVATLFDDGKAALAVTHDGCVHDICTATAATQPISLQSHPILLKADMAQLPLRIIWNVFGETLHLTLSLLGERGESNYGYKLCEVKVEGSVNAPIPLPVFSIPTRSVRLGISGTAPSGTIIRATDLYVSEKPTK